MNRQEAQKEFRSIVTNVSRDTIYTKFKKRCAEDHRSIKSVLIELMQSYVYREK